MSIWADFKNWAGIGTSSVPPMAAPSRSETPLPSPETSSPPVHHPVIGVSGAGADSKSVAAMMAQLRAQGNDPVLIADHAKRIAQHGSAKAAVEHDLAKLDGLAIMGNNYDVDPKRYGQAAGANTKVDADPSRAEYEAAATDYLLEKKLPGLFICGGMQSLNVQKGGTLIQHIPDLLGGDNYHDQAHVKGSEIAPFVPVQAVHILHESKLADIAGSQKSVYVPQPGAQLPSDIVLENSFHHQAIDKVADGFQVAARSDEDRVKGGIVQAIEPKPDGQYANQFLLGVQWHPEFGASDLGPKIISGLSAAAREHALTHAQQEAAEPAPDLQAGEHVQRLMQQRAMLQRQQQFVMAQ